MKKIVNLLVLVSAELAAFVCAAGNVVLRSQTAICEIAPEDGARIVSWRVNGRELLWNPSTPAPKDGKWRHGGVPLVWPWVADEWPADVEKSPHGVAWKHPFKVESRRTSEISDEITMSFSAYALRAEYTVTLSDRLSFRFKTKNTGDKPRRYAMSLHPYFRLQERDRTVIKGFDALRYRDMRAGFVTNGVWKGDVKVVSWLDHEFYRGTAPMKAEFNDGDCRITVSSADSAAYVVWNPGDQWPVEGTEMYGGLEKGAWRHILSVEPSSADLKDAVPLRPGEERTLTAEFVCRE
ncbi:MAG: hypothetical protein J6T01_05890 [Kiritimatiellae bacterium]|nr:hypothetical protein [Kiritimatiellia bacterium]